jgi:hypothetical protein
LGTKINYNNTSEKQCSIVLNKWKWRVNSRKHQGTWTTRM